VAYVEVYGWTKAYVDSLMVLEPTTMYYNEAVCSPSDPTLATSLTCTFPMGLFTGTGLNYVHVADGDALPFKIKA